jgi:hypothetical protein
MSHRKGTKSFTKEIVGKIGVFGVGGEFFKAESE